MRPLLFFRACRIAEFVNFDRSQVLAAITWGQIYFATLGGQLKHAYRYDRGRTVSVVLSVSVRQRQLVSGGPTGGLVLIARPD